MLTVGVGRINTAELARSRLCHQDKVDMVSTWEEPRLAGITRQFAKQKPEREKWMRSYTVWAVIRAAMTDSVMWPTVRILPA